MEHKLDAILKRNNIRLGILPCIKGRLVKKMHHLEDFLNAFLFSGHNQIR